ncbi:CPBP family intramembrane metalloprotease [Schumannella luteola]|uniref:Membrane protease YdiL (CAAX protease family) n=1 Tax=Schumannella luteola TaxID=472059 RepID=A0A852YH79_9MICO|nr:CPBP family intramembrane glutamic endopeptidase [Schumannella luteola]NYG99187.1 membrane protease YdiL (CAAX protease family) [Schumannella luteola]
MDPNPVDSRPVAATAPTASSSPAGPAGAGDAAVDSAPAPASLDPADRQRERNAAHPERGPLFPATVPWRAVLVFLLVALGGAWLVMLPVWLSGEGLTSPLFGVLTSAMMFTPTLAAFVVVLFVNRPPSIPRLLGLGPLRPVKRTLGMVLLASVLLSVLPLAALFLGSAMGLVKLDLAHFSALAATLEAAGQPHSPEDVSRAVVMQLALIPLIIVIDAFATFGEELGWRGWLLPNLRPLGTLPALGLSGAIWGVWHAPIILLGYNYQRTDALGVLLMTGWCVLLGVVVGWMRLRSASVWPAVFAHAALNATTNIYMIFVDRDSVATSTWGSILGWSGWIVLGLTIVVLLATGQLRKQPKPGLTLAETQPGAAARVTIR